MTATRTCGSHPPADRLTQRISSQEDEGYERVGVPVATADGDSVLAMCYLWPEAAQHVEIGARQLGKALVLVFELGGPASRNRAADSTYTHTHTACDTHQERRGEVELTRPWSYQGFREALLEEFVRDVVLPCAAEAEEVERQRSGIDRFK